MRFSDLPLDSRLQRAIALAGYSEPTPIQARAIPAALEGSDIIGTADTGTGKTAAFALPVLQSLLGPFKEKRTRALIVAPTRELAEQVEKTVTELARFTHVRCAAVYGGVGMGPQEGALRRGTEIIVACPGRLLDHVGRGTARLSSVETLVLDEADRMLDMGFMPSVRRIIQELPARRQTLLFTATFGPEMEAIASGLLRNPVRIDQGGGSPVGTVAHAVYPVAEHLKAALVIRLIRGSSIESALVFTRTKHRADRLGRQLEKAGFAAAVLHSGKTQSQRKRALDGFRSGSFRLLVATDVAARGIDVKGISHVINFDAPDTVDSYVHRIGRTGRAKEKGDAFTLVTRKDVPLIESVEIRLGSRIPAKTLPGFDCRV